MESSDKVSADVSSKQHEQEDPELDSLLESALQDFDSLNLSSDASKQVESNNNSQTAISEGESNVPVENANVQPPSAQAGMANWNDMLNDQMLAEFEKVMQDLVKGDDGKKFMDNLEEISKAATAQTGSATETQPATMASQGASFPAAAADGMDENLSQILKGLADNAEALKQPSDSLNFGASPEDMEKLLPAMQGMMENLLAKDVIYPSVKETTAKYSKWLQENQGKCDPEAYARYCSQCDLMREICCEYESEQPNDSQEVRHNRFERLTELMNKMHDFGQPPSDVVGNVNPGLEVDENGAFKMPPNMKPEECCLM